MALNCGIVGLPNVGKSSLFSALTSIPADIANYPFCTIEPNIGLVQVPDNRLEILASAYQPEKTIPAACEFVDIAGLVRGASKGDGLGNRFLAHIREAGIIAHVLRCFHDNNVSHVSGNIDPRNDIETIEAELCLADLETVQKKKVYLEKERKKADLKTKKTVAVMDSLLFKLEESLNSLIPVSQLNLETEEAKMLQGMNLLSSKKTLFVCNVDEENLHTGNTFTRIIEDIAHKRSSEAIRICAKLEAELVEFDPEDRKRILLENRQSQSGLSLLIQKVYHLLDLQCFFTVGKKEVKAWTIRKGTLAPRAAGIIHSDFQRGFIRAEVFSLDDLLFHGSEQKIRAAGKLRSEGKEYVIQDGDVVYFKFNV